VEEEDKQLKQLKGQDIHPPFALIEYPEGQVIQLPDPHNRQVES
jgi:hypothetical protein